VAKDDRTTVPATVIDRLFVYGTLRAGQTSRSIVAAYVGRSTPAVARGSMYAFPSGHPGVVPDDAGDITGELLELNDLAAALPLLDAFEGEDFLRVLTEVQVGDHRAWAWMYVLVSPALARLGVRVAHGDWPRYLAELP